ncbi:centrosomin isoform X2 [Nasonia vitripennis]|uniref:Centrosomin N-terminal motif 1 domain-containing protein n=1 Tax=Nasonia vitripennis TaxID=7425 RepID=A0A7M7IPN3_NASVI|nr:centrosomin isoform X2 [Nasonia vitripennis]
MFFSNFGYSSNPNSPPSPTKGSLWGSAYSPFRNTNLPLPNVTMDQTIPMVNGANAKSPGKTSPVGGGMVGGQGIGGPGRTMKECEDELGALKKANFNLKLRIYFLEERMGITSADEDPVRKNIELKVVNESLRKDLIEKQELLSQAAKAIELYEEQKQVSARNQAQYQHTLEQERARADSLEKELEEYRGRLTDATFYEETFGITPEKALEYKEKLHQVEEIKSSLESELKQLSASLEEERNWAQELENERDQLRDRLETEIASKEKLSIKRDREIESLNDRVRELEEELFKRDNSLQQFRKEIIEKDKVIEEKTCLLEDKCKAYEEVTSVAEKRKKQIDQLRLSVKTRDDALTDLNNKNRSLLSQFENTYAKRSTSPNSPSVFMEESQHLRKTFALNSPTKSFNGSLDFEPSNDRSRAMFELHNSLERRNSQELRKELEEKEREVKKQVELTKQLSLKLDTVQQSADVTDQKLKKLETDHRKAIQMIQGFMKRHEQLEDKQAKKDRRIMELEGELSRLKNENAKTVRSSVHSSIRRNLSTDLVDDPERDYNGQQRFEEMESKINDLRDQIDEIKAEKNLLEKQIQIESEELRDRLQDKDLKIECLVCEKNSIKDELQGKSEELDKLKEAYDRVSAKSDVQNPAELEKLREELAIKNLEIEEKSQQVERLTKELQVKTQNLQQLVNTELWSKNKEIAKLHNHMTASQYQEKSRNKSLDGAEKAGAQLNTLIKELNDIGIQVTFMNDIIQLNYVNSDKPVDVLTLTNYIHKLIAQKNDLEKEVDYLKWLKLVSKPANDSMTDVCDSTTERDKQYCELLRTHLKELMKFMKEMLRSTDETTDTVNNKQKKIVLDALMNSKILSDDFLNALEGMRLNEQDAAFDRDDRIDGSVRKSKSENFIDSKNQFSTPSDSEAFSEPDRMVSLARMGLPDIKQKSATRSRPSKFAKTFSDSEDSIDYHPCHKVYQSDVSDFDANRQILELKDINSFLYSELNALRNEVTKTRFDDAINGKLSLLLNKLDKSRSFCEKLQNTLERKIHECHTLKKESKQNSVRKLQLEKKMLDVDNMALEVAKQKAELTLYKESTDRKTTEMLITLNKENDMLRSKIKKLEEDNEEAKAMILRLTRELDHLTLTHSQILVENTKLTNDKLRLEQEVRKTESRYDVTVRTLQEKFHKEVTDLNQINESHRARVQELETTNKELRRHVVICEASDSAPSSSGISSIPPDVASKQACDDILNEYHTYNGSPYWLPVTYPLSSGRSKSSCSPDLGIESDAAVTSTRPLKDTLKITESMTNLLSDDDNCNNNPGLRDIDGDSPLPIEGLDEVQSLKEENVALKRRLMKTRRALEDTFQHLSASNKNKKNVEKAITKQLMITKSVLKKTRNYEDTHYEN